MKILELAGGTMNSEISAQEINSLIANTLYHILKDRFKKSGQNSMEKSLLCLEGFSHDVFIILKDLYGTNADFFWTGEEIRGEELVQKRNDSNTKKPLIVFISDYFPESQSLQHFSRLTEKMLLVEDSYLKILIETAFTKKITLKLEDNLLTEAIKKIVNILAPSLLVLAKYLDSVGKKPASNPDQFYENMGKSLYHLGTFSYKKLIKDNKKINSKGKDLLKLSFETYLKHNLQYSRPNYRHHFTNERLTELKDDKKRRLLFDFAKNENIEKCLEDVDFEDVKGMLKRPRISPGKKASDKGDDYPEKSIWEGLLRNEEEFRKDEDNILSCKFGSSDDIKGFKVKLKPIPQKDFLKPFPDFENWNSSLAKAIENNHKESKKSKSTENDDSENNIEIEITLYLDLENSDRKISFQLDCSENENKIPGPGDTNEWSKWIEKSNSEEIKNAAIDFKEKRNEILKQEHFTKSGFVTMAMDIEGYICSYIALVNEFLRNADKYASYDWYMELLKEFIALDFIKGEKELNIFPTHPFILFKQRLKEILFLELLRSGLRKDKSGWFEFIKEIENGINDIFAGCWPHYIALEEGKPPFNFRIIEEEPGYKYHAREDYYPQKSHIDKTLNPQIEKYVTEHPLAQHCVRLTVLNPFDGKDLFTAIEKLYNKNPLKQTPQSIFFTAVGPNDNETLSFFDSKNEEVEMFMKQANGILPFCRYEKCLIKDEDWVISYLKKDEFKKKSSDIVFAVDPFWQKYGIKDNLMPYEESEAIMQNFKDFPEANFDVLLLLTGPDRIYLRLALEALSIMAVKRSKECRKYIENNANSNDYELLFNTVQTFSQWTILQDRNINDYYAEELSKTIEILCKKPVSVFVQNILQGGVYLFITPSQQNDENLHTKSLPAHLKEDKRFIAWFKAIYYKFNGSVSFVKEFFSSSFQWFVPVNLLPEWIIEWKEEQNKGQEEDQNVEDDNSVSIDRDPADYLLRIAFQPEENLGFSFTTSIHTLKNNELERSNEIVTDFSDILKISEGKKNEDRLFNILRRKTLYRTLLSLINNPYQSWFLSLMNRENIDFIENKKEKYGHYTDVEAIGKMRIWELRRLTTYLIRLYSKNPGIYLDYYLRLRDFFRYIDSNIPDFKKLCLVHLKKKNPKLFETNEYLKNILL